MNIASFKHSSVVILSLAVSLVFAFCAVAGVNVDEAYAATAKPAKAAVSSFQSVSVGKATVVAKKAKRAKGYQFKVGTNKSLTKNAKKKTTTKRSATFSGLQQGKKYYAKVRAYAKDGSKKVWGAWSKPKSVIVKKASSSKPKTPDNNHSSTSEDDPVSTVSFALSAKMVLQGRDFRAGDAFTFVVAADEGAPLPENTQVTITPTSGGEASVGFGDIKFTIEDVGRTYAYTIRESGAGETAGGVTNDPSSHVVKLRVDASPDGTLAVVPEYQGGTSGVVFTNTYCASGQAQIQAAITLSGRELADDEFFFELSGDNLAAPLSASAAADGSVAFAPIAFTLDDAGRSYAYTISETQGTLGGVTYDAATHEVVVSVADNGDGTLAVSCDYDDGGGVPVFTNTYHAKGTSVQLGAHKALVGGVLAEGQFSFALQGISENAKDVAQTASNAADGTIAFDALGYDEPGTYVYEISEVIPVGAVDNGDGTFTGSDGICYDGATHTATVDVVDDGGGKLRAAVTYDEDAGGISFGNTVLVRTGFEFSLYYFGGLGTFDFKMTAVDAQGTPRPGIAADYSDARVIVDDGARAFTATVQNGAFSDGKASIVFPELAYVADGDYYYLIEEEESSASDVVVDKASFLAHVVVEDGQEKSRTFDLIYDGVNLGPTDDLAFYNNAAVNP